MPASTTTATTMTTATPVIGPKDCVGGTRVQSKGEVKLAVIAPGDHHEQSLPRVLPAVLLAVRYISSPKGPLPGWNIKVDHRDSHCSSTYGPLAAFEFYINQTAGRTSALATLFLCLLPRFPALFLVSLCTSFPSAFVSDVIAVACAGAELYLPRFILCFQRDDIVAPAMGIHDSDLRYGKDWLSSVEWP